MSEYLVVFCQPCTTHLAPTSKHPILYQTDRKPLLENKPRHAQSENAFLDASQSKTHSNLPVSGWRNFSLESPILHKFVLLEICSESRQLQNRVSEKKISGKRSFCFAASIKTARISLRALDIETWLAERVFSGERDFLETMGMQSQKLKRRNDVKLITAFN